MNRILLSCLVLILIRSIFCNVQSAVVRLSVDQNQDSDYDYDYYEQISRFEHNLFGTTKCRHTIHRTNVRDTNNNYLETKLSVFCFQIKDSK